MWIVCPIAGVGSRLAPFTYTKPKAFMKVAGKRVIDHLMLKLQKTFDRGTDIMFVVGYKKKQITEYLLEHYSEYFSLHFVEQEPRGYRADIPYFSGLGAAISLAEDFVKDDDLLIILSDRLPMQDFSSMLVKFLKPNGGVPLDGVINVQKVPDPQHYGVIQLSDEGTVKCIVEKPSEYVSDLAVSGAYLFSKRVVPRLFQYLRESMSETLEEGREYQFTPIIERLIKEGCRVGVNEMAEKILDFGRPENFLEGNSLLLQQMNQVEFAGAMEGVELDNAEIIPPVFIGSGTRVSRCNLGPNVSVGDGCVLEKCILSNAVVGDGVHLSRVISENSIVGDWVVLEDLIKDNITIGDSSCIATTKWKK
ncbi:MAG: sugar phosphate nucleotidyltransferase [Promethearchaeota archaeon]